MEKYFVSCTRKELFKKIKDILKKGHATHIRIKTESGKTLLDIPVTMGVLVFGWAPLLAGFSLGLSWATKCQIQVVTDSK
jgi:hypothetical protein